MSPKNTFRRILYLLNTKAIDEEQDLDNKRHLLHKDLPSSNVSNSTELTINKTIYMTYKKNVPNKVKTRWIDCNKDYNIDFSLDKDCIEFLQTNFNDYLASLFIKIKIGMYKADLWRLCKLYINSGVYADVDLVPYINIDNLDKNITYYSCLALDQRSIFQAFMVSFSKPKDPLFLVFLLSFLINKPYNRRHVMPTHDMYNCLKYILNTKTILSDKHYEVDSLKIKISIGTSKSNIKKINLYYFPDNINYTIKLHKHNVKDNLDIKIENNYLIVERVDKISGWDHKHYVDICFPSKASFYFFKERMWKRGYVNAFITYKQYKILDSRDKEYFINKGW